jgi:hypothetical protein
VTTKTVQDVDQRNQRTKEIIKFTAAADVLLIMIAILQRPLHERAFFFENKLEINLPTILAGELLSEAAKQLSALKNQLGKLNT